MSPSRRTCVGCRTRHPPEDLLRVRQVASGDIVPAVRRAELAATVGRSAYLCPSLQCFNRAVKRGGFARAFSRQGRVHVDSARLWSTLSTSLRTEIELFNRCSRDAAASPRVHRLQQLEAALHDASAKVEV